MLKQYWKNKYNLMNIICVQNFLVYFILYYMYMEIYLFNHIFLYRHSKKIFDFQ